MSSYPCLQVLPCFQVLREPSQNYRNLAEAIENHPKSPEKCNWEKVITSLFPPFDYIYKIGSMNLWVNESTMPESNPTKGNEK